MLTLEELEQCSHFGQVLLRSIRKEPRDEVFQIDASNDSTETYGSVLTRSVRLARALARAGLAPGDVLALAGYNHLDLHIPYYAGLMCGLPVAAMDPYFKYDEIRNFLTTTKPKVAFVQQKIVKNCERAAEELGIGDIKIVAFDGKFNIQAFVETYDDPNANDDEYEPPTFDPRIFAWLVPTSGTTGVPKMATFSHKLGVKKLCELFQHSSAGQGRLALILSPMQWVSSYFNSLWTLLTGFKKLQTATPDDIDHVIDLINKYKPSTLFSSPATPALILKNDKPCDWTCFDMITLTGAKVHKKVLQELKSLMNPEALLIEAYGQTETLGPVLMPNLGGPLGSCGVISPYMQFKLVDPETEKEVTDPNVPGEAWVKGELLFDGYYNNPEETAALYSADGWLKTGDLLYRDEQDNFFYVNRIKMLIKYRNYHIIPPEIEGVILRHPEVLEAGVVGITHPEDGQRAAALVVTKLGASVTEKEIDDLVAESLSEKKRLRGGVIFVESLPKTSTGKLARAKLQQEFIRLYNLREHSNKNAL